MANWTIDENIDAFRAKNPSYQNWSDDDLTYGVWDKYYRNDISHDEFKQVFAGRKVSTPHQRPISPISSASPILDTYSRYLQWGNESLDKYLDQPQHSDMYRAVVGVPAKTALYAADIPVVMGMFAADIVGAIGGGLANVAARGVKALIDWDNPMNVGPGEWGQRVQDYITEWSHVPPGTEAGKLVEEAMVKLFQGFGWAGAEGAESAVIASKKMSLFLSFQRQEEAVKQALQQGQMTPEEAMEAITKLHVDFNKANEEIDTDDYDAARTVGRVTGEGLLAVGPFVKGFSPKARAAKKQAQALINENKARMMLRTTAEGQLNPNIRMSPAEVARLRELEAKYPEFKPEIEEVTPRQQKLDLEGGPEPVLRDVVGKYGPDNRTYREFREKGGHFTDPVRYPQVPFPDPAVPVEYTKPEALPKNLPIEKTERPVQGAVPLGGTVVDASKRTEFDLVDAARTLEKENLALDAVPLVSPARRGVLDFADIPSELVSDGRPVAFPEPAIPPVPRDVPTAVEYLADNKPYLNAVAEIQRVEGDIKTFYDTLQQMHEPGFNQTHIPDYFRMKRKEGEKVGNTYKSWLKWAEQHTVDLNKRWWNAQEVMQKEMLAAEKHSKMHEVIWADVGSIYRGNIKLPKKMGGWVNPKLMEKARNGVYTMIDQIKMMGSIDAYKLFGGLIQPRVLHMNAIKAAKGEGGMIWAEPSWFQQVAGWEKGKLFAKHTPEHVRQSQTPLKEAGLADLKEIAEKQGFDEQPKLVIDIDGYGPNGELYLKAIGHNGRHRAETIHRLGLDAMPVFIQMTPDTVKLIKKAQEQGKTIKIKSQEDIRFSERGIFDFPNLIDMKPYEVVDLFFEDNFYNNPHKNRRTPEVGYSVRGEQWVMNLQRGARMPVDQRATDPHLAQITGRGPNRQRGSTIYPSVVADLLGVGKDKSSLWSEANMRKMGLADAIDQRGRINEGKVDNRTDPMGTKEQVDMHERFLNFIDNGAVPISDWHKVMSKEEMMKDVPESLLTRLATGGLSWMHHFTGDPKIGHLHRVGENLIRRYDLKAHMVLSGELRTKAGGLAGVYHAPNSPRGIRELLSNSQKDSLAELANRFNGVKDLTRQEILDLGYHPQVATAYEILRRALTVAHKDMKAAGLEMGWEPGFFPLNRRGEYRLDIMDGDGKTLVTEFYNTLWERHAEMKSLQKEFGPGYQFKQSFVDRLKGQDNPYTKGGEAAIGLRYIASLLDKADPRIGEIKKVMKEVRGKGGFGVHKIQRKKDLGGRNLDRNTVFESVDDYVQGAYRYTRNKKLDDLRAELAKQPDLLHAKNFLEIANEYINRVSGHTGIENAKGALAILNRMSYEVIAAPVRAMGYGHQHASKVVSALQTAFMIKALFAWRVPFLTAQVVQPYQFQPAMLMHYKLKFPNADGAAMSMYKGQKLLIEYMANTKNAAEFTEFINGYLKPRGGIDGRFVSEAANVNLFRDKNINKSLEFLSGITPAQGVEIFGRLETAAVGFEFFKSAGLKGKELRAATERFVTDVMVDYSPQARPPWAYETGIAGRLAGPLSTFATHYWATTIMFIKDALANPTNPKAYLPMASHIASSVIYGGMMGMIGIQGVNAILWLLGTITGQDFGTAQEHILKMTGGPDRGAIDDMISHGVLSGATGINFQSSLAAPEFSAPGLKSFPAVNMVSDFAKMVNKTYQTYRDTGEFDARQMRRMWPTIWQKWMENYEADDIADAHSFQPGFYVNPGNRNRGTDPVNSKERLARWMGATTVNGARERVAVELAKTNEEDLQMYRRLNVDQAVKAFLHGENQKIPRLLQNLVESGLTRKQAERQIKRLILESYKSRAQQYALGAHGRPETETQQRKYQSITSMGVNLGGM